jgi:hypothetical protein
VRSAPAARLWIRVISVAPSGSTARSLSTASAHATPPSRRDLCHACDRVLAVDPVAARGAKRSSRRGDCNRRDRVSRSAASSWPLLADSGHGPMPDGVPGSVPASPLKEPRRFRPELAVQRLASKHPPRSVAAEGGLALCHGCDHPTGARWSTPERRGPPLTVVCAGRRPGL